MTDNASRPQRRKKEAPAEKAPTGKQRILEAAERLFASRGFLDVSAAEIVREAGVAHGLLFHHFGAMEDLYAEVSRMAAQRMNEVQLASFRGKTAREQVAAFLRAHLRSVKQREGDALFRARSHNVATHAKVAAIWEASRQEAIDRVCEALGLETPPPAVRVCLRAWIGFHDQLVLAWLSEHTISERHVMDWTMKQLEHLTADVLSVDLDRTTSQPSTSARPSGAG
ncbi:TetR/AcrR family transcriptional regulator [Pseudacidovorax intermedius]|uniref:TetR/AcrR family transcriptional regulator n=1 Tax=Pseudacidovorax intermedius TaxID=433924 RepID=UPI0026F18582|nr:TetR/AcrR family transcriptional regulator [Pseudacidovorax intermedius]